MAEKLLGPLWRKQYKVTRVVTILLSILFSFAVLVGSKVNVSNATFGNISPYTVVQFFLLSCLSYFILIGLYGCVCHIEPLLWQKEQLLDCRKVGIIIFVFILICWIPYFLIYYPGSMTYDSNNVAGQAVMGFPPTDWHPFTYTLLVRVIMRFGMLFGDINTGVAAYSLCQMALMAGAIAYGISWLYKKHLRLYFVVFITLYFSIIPIFPLLSITMWKDIPFAVCLLLYTLCLYDIIESKGKTLCCFSGTVKFIVLASLIGLLRHNGFYIILLTAVLLAIYFRKILKKILPALLVPLLLVPLVENIYYANGVKKPEFSESLSIPAQQIARTVVYNGTITGEQWEEINRLFDLKQLNGYDPLLADNVKSSLRGEYLESHKLQFFKLWVELMPSNFSEYCKAYIMETVGYWMPGIHSWIVLPLADDGAKLGVHQINLIQGFTGDIWKGMWDLFQFISIGTMVWATAFFIGLTLIKRRVSDLIAFLPLFILWLTLMAATPVYCEFRYILALPLSLPFIACMSMRKLDSAEGNNSIKSVG